MFLNLSLGQRVANQKLLICHNQIQSALPALLSLQQTEAANAIWLENKGLGESTRVLMTVKTKWPLQIISSVIQRTRTRK